MLALRGPQTALEEGGPVTHSKSLSHQVSKSQGGTTGEPDWQQCKAGGWWLGQTRKDRGQGRARRQEETSGKERSDSKGTHASASRVQPRASQPEGAQPQGEGRGLARGPVPHRPSPSPGPETPPRTSVPEASAVPPLPSRVTTLRPGSGFRVSASVSVGPRSPRSPFSRHDRGPEPAHRAHIWRLHLPGRRRLLPHLLPAPPEAGGVPEGAGCQPSWYCPGRCAATRVESVV